MEKLRWHPTARQQQFELTDRKTDIKLEVVVRKWDKVGIDISQLGTDSSQMESDETLIESRAVNAAKGKKIEQNLSYPQG